MSGEDSSNLAVLLTGISLGCFCIIAIGAMLRDFRWWPPHVMANVALPALFLCLILLHRPMIQVGLAPATWDYGSPVGQIMRWCAAISWMRLIYLMATGRLYPKLRGPELGRE